MMKVLFFAPAGEYGGAYSLLRLLEQAQGRFEPIVVCPAPTTLSRRLHSLGIEYHPFEFNRFSLKRRPDWHVRMIWRLYRLLRRRKIDIIVVNHTGNFALIMLAARLARVPVVRFMRHSLGQLKGGKLSNVDLKYLPRCAGLIFITRSVEAETRASVANLPPSLTLYNPQHLPSADEIGDLDSVRSELEIGPTDIVLGVFGRLERSKGQDVLIRALSRLRSRYPELRLLIVGESYNAAAREELVRLIDSLTLASQVRFTGRREDVLSVMSLCRIVVMPSRSEALGRILLEAWSVLRPVIGSNVEGIKEVVEASGGGLLFEMDSEIELAARIEELMEDPATRERLATRGHNWLKENCDPSRYADSFAGFLRQIIVRHWSASRLREAVISAATEHY